MIFAGAFAWGVFELFKLRFESGGVYPPYSTLRSDPLGASAYYESLKLMPGLSVSRDFRVTDEMPEGNSIVYLQLAGTPDSWEELPEDTFKSIDSFVRSGGRLVVAFFPQPIKPHISRFEKPDEDGNEDNSKKMDKHSTNQPDSKYKPLKHSKKKKHLIGSEDEGALVSIYKRWGVGFDIKNMTNTDGDTYVPLTVENDSEPTLPQTMAWHSGIVMTNLGEAWRVIYSRDADAVLAQRKLGKGMLVFSTDSFFLSNEALQRDRHPELLAWLAGSCPNVIFDEAHFGIVDNPGIATLVRKYRLHGLVFSLLVLAGLFIWKNSLGFGPVRQDEEREAYVAGKDSAAGFINLLRHHIKPYEVLPTCLAEWKKSQPKGKYTAARIERVEAFMLSESQLPARERNPVRAYQTICVLLAKSSGFRMPAAESQSNTKKI